jgi:broad specificity phosphatase PhoE
LNDAIFVRHAVSNYNLADLISSSPDDEECVLTSAGRLQSAALRLTLSRVGIGLCATSQLRRAKQTVDVALAGRRIRRVEIPELNDVSAGEFDRQPAAAYLDWLERGSDWGSVPPRGGESLVQAATRYQTGFRWLLQCAEPNVLVITHALPVALALYARIHGNSPGGSCSWSFSPSAPTGMLFPSRSSMPDLTGLRSNNCEPR